MSRQDYDAAKVGLIGAAGTAAVAKGVQEGLAGVMDDYADQLNQGGKPTAEVHMAIFGFGWWLAIIPTAIMHMESIFETTSALAAIGTLLVFWLLLAVWHETIDALLRQGLIFEGVALNAILPFIANITVAHYYPTTGILAHFGLWIVARSVVNEVFDRVAWLRRVRHGVMTFAVGIALLVPYIVIAVCQWQGYHPG